MLQHSKHDTVVVRSKQLYFIIVGIIIVIPTFICNSACDKMSLACYCKLLRRVTTKRQGKFDAVCDKLFRLRFMMCEGTVAEKVKLFSRLPTIEQKNV